MVRILNFSRTTVARFSRSAPVIHVRFAGETFDLPLANLDIGRVSSDLQIRHAVATALMIPPDGLDDHAIDRHSNGNLSLRPASVFA